MGFKQIDHDSITPPEGSKLFCQVYEKPESIDGVHVIKINTFSDDFGGWFKEIMRLDQDGNNLALKEVGVNFRPIQVNMSFLAPHRKILAYPSGTK